VKPGDNWVIAAVVVRLPTVSRPVAIPVLAKLVIKGTSSASRLWLARRMAGAIAATLPEVREEVAGLLGGPLPGGMRRDGEDADARGRVLDHGQDVSLGAVEQAGSEEVARQDRLGRGAQQL